MADFYTTQFADNIRLAHGKKLISPVDGVYNVIRLPHKAFLKQVWVYVSTAYIGGNPTLEVGFIGNKETADTNAFITTMESDPTFAGLKTSLGGNAIWADGKYFDVGSGIITVTTDDDGGTAGTFIVFADYMIVH